jgi:hypothetical protein
VKEGEVAKRTLTVAALRTAIRAVQERIDALKDERGELHQCLANALCPLEVGDRFTAEGVPAFGARPVAREDIFVAVQIGPRGHGLRDPNRIGWNVTARRVLKSGGASARTYLFTKENRVKKIAEGSESR